MLFLQSYIKFDSPRKSGFKEVVSLANSLESEAEEDEKKEMEYSSSAPQKSRHVNSASKKSQYIVKFGLCTLRNKGVEVWKAIMFLMLGFYTERRKKVFTLFFLPSKLSRHSA